MRQILKFNPASSFPAVRSVQSSVVPCLVRGSIPRRVPVQPLQSESVPFTRERS
jgi:hypothetical protein